MPQLKDARASDVRAHEEELAALRQQHAAARVVQRRRCVERVVAELSLRLEKTCLRLMSRASPLVHAPLCSSASAPGPPAMSSFEASPGYAAADPSGMQGDSRQLDVSSLSSWEGRAPGLFLAASQSGHSGVRPGGCDSFFKPASVRGGGRGGGGACEAGEEEGEEDGGGEDGVEGGADEDRGAAGDVSSEVLRFEEVVCQWVCEQLANLRRSCSARLAADEQTKKAERESHAAAIRQHAEREQRLTDEAAALRTSRSDAAARELAARNALAQLEEKHKRVSSQATATLGSLQSQIQQLRRWQAEVTLRMAREVEAMLQRAEGAAEGAEALVRGLVDARRTAVARDRELQAAQAELRVYQRSARSRADEARAGRRALAMMSVAKGAHSLGAGVKGLLHREQLKMAEASAEIVAAVSAADARLREHQAQAVHEQRLLAQRADAAEADQHRARAEGSKAAASAQADLSDAFQRVQVLEQVKADLEQQLSSQNTHLEAVQGHLETVRETVRLQADELRSCRSGLARQGALLEESKSRASELSHELQGVAARLEASEHTLASVKDLLRGKEKEAARLQEQVLGLGVRGQG